MYGTSNFEMPIFNTSKVWEGFTEFNRGSRDHDHPAGLGVIHHPNVALALAIVNYDATVIGLPYMYVYQRRAQFCHSASSRQEYSIRPIADVVLTFIPAMFIGDIQLQISVISYNDDVFTEAKD